MKKLLTFTTKSATLTTVVQDMRQQTERMENMTNTKKLEAKIKESGLKKSYLAEKLGVSKQTFRNLCVNKSEFTAAQIQILCQEMNIGLAEMKAIFFAQLGA